MEDFFEFEEYSIDRFEEDFAVLENRDTGEMKNVPVEEIPEDSQEGDILDYVDNEYILNRERTEEIENDIDEKYDDLWE